MSERLSTLLEQREAINNIFSGIDIFHDIYRVVLIAALVIAVFMIKRTGDFRYTRIAGSIIFAVLVVFHSFIECVLFAHYLSSEIVGSVVGGVIGLYILPYIAYMIWISILVVMKKKRERLNSTENNQSYDVNQLPEADSSNKNAMINDFIESRKQEMQTISRKLVMQVVNGNFASISNALIKYMDTKTVDAIYQELSASNDICNTKTKAIAMELVAYQLEKHKFALNTNLPMIKITELYDKSLFVQNYAFSQDSEVRDQRFFLERFFPSYDKSEQSLLKKTIHKKDYWCDKIELSKPGVNDKKVILFELTKSKFEKGE